MDSFGPYSLSGSTENYDRWRRRRQWSMRGPQGLRGYAEFLAGVDGGTVWPEAGGVIASQLSAVGNSDWVRPIAIGVATSALAFMVNRWLGRVFK
jgi:hypothetical protein